MIYFDIIDFPSLKKEVESRQEAISKTLVNLGYSSAVYDHLKCLWGVSESDYTWMVLRWSK